jgi:Fe2+ or Zn2+ uptake regulation protein
LDGTIIYQYGLVNLRLWKGSDGMICERCGNLMEECECEIEEIEENEEERDIAGDDPRFWGYDGDCW